MKFGDFQQRNMMPDLAVRLSAKTPDKNGIPQDDTLGSGVIIEHKGTLYLATCGHCTPTGNPSDVLAEYQSRSGDFFPLQVTRRIFHQNDDLIDLSLYEVDPLAFEFSDRGAKLSVVIPQYNRNIDNLAYSYPKENREGILLELRYATRDSWAINNHIESGDTTLKNAMEGCSGSGVIDFSDNIPVCLGLIRAFSDSHATHRQLKVIPDTELISIVHEGNVSQQPQEKYDDPLGYIQRYCDSSRIKGWGRLIGEKMYSLLEYLNGNVPESVSNHILLVGAAQTGKTYELRHTAYQLVSDKNRVKLIRLRGVNSLKDLNLDSYSDMDVIMLDGLDELRIGCLYEIAEKISNFARQHPLTKIVVSCRENYADLLEASSFSIYRLQNLTGEEVEDYIRTHSEDSDLVIAQIKNAGIVELCTNPFNLNTILTLGQKENGEFHLPDSVVSIYEKYIDSLYNIEIGIPANEALASRNTTERFLKEVAYRMIRAGKDSLSRDEILEVVRTEEGITALMRNGVVVRDKLGDNEYYSFVANGVREFLAAEKLLDIGLEAAKKEVCLRGTDIINRKLYNVVRLWLSHLSTMGAISTETIDWVSISDNDATLLLDCSPESIDDKVRLDVSMNILSHFKSRDIIFGGYDLDAHRRLYRFAKSEIFFDHLFTELNNESEANANLNNLMSLCAFLPWKKWKEEKSERYGQFKSVLFEKIHQHADKVNNYSLYYWIAQNSSLYEDENFISEFMDNVGESENADTMSSVCFIIEKADLSDKYIDYLLKADNHIHNRETTVISRSSLFKAFGAVRSLVNIKTVINLVLNEDYLRTQYTDEDDYYNMIRQLLTSFADNPKWEKTFVETLLSKLSTKNYLTSPWRQKILSIVEELVLKYEINNTDLKNLIEETLYPASPSGEEINKRKKQYQAQFDMLWNHQEFKEEIQRILDLYDPIHSDRWYGNCLSEKYGYNHQAADFVSKHGGWIDIDVSNVVQAIDDISEYELYRFERSVDIVTRNNSNVSISKERLEEIKQKAENILIAAANGNSGVEYNYLQAALKMLVGGHLKLDSEMLIGLLPLSFESFQVWESGDVTICRNEKVFDVIERTCDKSHFLDALRNAVYAGDPNHIDIQTWVRYLVNNGTSEDREKLYSMMLNNPSSPICYYLLDDLLEDPQYDDKMVADFDAFTPYDQLKIFTKIVNDPDKKDMIIQKLERVYESYPEPVYKDALRKLTAFGSQKALDKLTADLAYFNSHGEFFTFSYWNPKALPQLVSLLHTISEYDGMFWTVRHSLETSIGNISSLSEDAYEEVKRVVVNTFGETPYTNRLLDNCRIRYLVALDEKTKS